MKVFVDILKTSKDSTAASAVVNKVAEILTIPYKICLSDFAFFSPYKVQEMFGHPIGIVFFTGETIFIIWLMKMKNLKQE